MSAPPARRSLKQWGAGMPKVASFDGIQIVFYHNEHPPAHFHAVYAEHRAVIEIGTMTMTEGYLPITQRRKVLAWARARKIQLIRAFVQAATHMHPENIP